MYFLQSEKRKIKIMNIEQAKAVQIVSFLKKTGIEPTKIYGKHYYYHAPYRTDKQPSFKVNTELNTWFDISENVGGKIINLVCKMYNCDVAKTLQIIGNENQIFLFSQSENTIHQTIKINHTQSLQNKALIQYLENRKIPFKVALKYVSESYYTLDGTNKKYFGIVFKNDLNGYEIRNKYFKGCTELKSITSIKVENSKQLNVFEGFFDFLSAMVYFKTDKPNHNTIILNSTTCIKQIENSLIDYEKINLFLDNDKTGINTVKFIQSKNQNSINQSAKLFPKFKDFNEFLCNET